MNLMILESLLLCFRKKNSIKLQHRTLRQLPWFRRPQQPQHPLAPLQLPWFRRPQQPQHSLAPLQLPWFRQLEQQPQHPLALLQLPWFR
ncbi:unnamed protein product [Adineta steineri]|uniref:Uncharacterized protein n=1 Tax=Adineta steineri TaxID=433720 RepID=A0A814VPV9_9BILA|nr:unnamed protein product [Adineta steineri]CAF1190695.1 unnamed protein product [Adineta steineri]CAF1219711.1 unnamed protein product [Adineta steineri]CAF1463546.1 unnamed protein product [Adineta steineri]CAF1633886.1 unnamed protein product [Adineta steineri]